MSQNKLWVVVPWALVGTVLAMLFLQRNGATVNVAEVLSPTVVAKVADSSSEIITKKNEASRTAGGNEGQVSSDIHDLKPENSWPKNGDSELTAEFLTLESNASANLPLREPVTVVLQELPRPQSEPVAQQGITQHSLVKSNSEPTPDGLPSNDAATNPALKGQKRVVNQFVVDGNQRGQSLSVSTSATSTPGSFRPQPITSPPATAGVGNPPETHLDRSSSDFELRTDDIHSMSSASKAGEPNRQLAAPSASVQLVVGLPPGIGHSAAQHIEYGKTLARRGAMFSARREFIEAMRVIATSLDQSRNTPFHTQELTRAWTILREAESLDKLRVAQSSNAAPIDLGQILMSHTSRVLTSNEAVGLNVEQILGKYYQQAKQCLANAVGANAVSAEALHCLGKLFVLMADHPNNSSTYCRDQAMAMFSAALDCNARHHHAANELGVLLASQGHLQAAKQRLWQSLQSHPTGQAWTNLAEIHQRLGELNLAADARLQADTYGNSESTDSNRLFQWVDPQTFDEGSEGAFATAGPEMDTNAQRAGQLSEGQAAEVGKSSSKPAWLQKILR